MKFSFQILAMLIMLGLPYGAREIAHCTENSALIVIKRVTSDFTSKIVQLCTDHSICLGLKMNSSRL